VVREANQCVGIYAVVREPGEVREGDAVERIG
jgi:MOSC domain-containing protein YiiM